MVRALSVTQAAKRLGVSAAAIRGWINDHTFPNAYKLHPMKRNSPYRIPESDITAFEDKRHASQAAR
jgi:predicted DNA-binding transcriptional regulator AlpA